LVVTDPVRFILAYTGQAAQGDNDVVFDWVKGLFMNGVRTTLGELCEVEQKSLLQCVSLTQKLANAFVNSAPDLNEIGVRILQMGQFQVNFSAEDRQRLVAANAEIAQAQRAVKVKQIGVAGAQADAQARQFELDQKFGHDARYVQQLAGNYQNYAAGQAMLGAGQGIFFAGVGVQKHRKVFAHGGKAQCRHSLGRAPYDDPVAVLNGQPQQGIAHRPPHHKNLHARHCDVAI
jgi:hypothetical protein